MLQVVNGQVWNSTSTGPMNVKGGVWAALCEETEHTRLGSHALKDREDLSFEKNLQWRRLFGGDWGRGCESL